MERRPFAGPGARTPEAKRIFGPSRSKESKEAAKPSDRSIPLGTPFGGMPPQERKALGSTLSGSLEQDLKTLRGIFRSPRNAALIVREFEIASRWGRTKAALVYLSGMVDEASIREHLLRPLMDLRIQDQSDPPTVERLSRTQISEPRVETLGTFSQATSAIVEGKTVFLLDGDVHALSCDTRAPEHRAVEESPTEAVVRGPHIGFVEDLTTNLALLRTFFSTPDLVAEQLYVGARGHFAVSIVYIEGIANPKLVDEVRRRITSVSLDAVSNTICLMAAVQESPANPFPKFLSTERPDRVAFMIAEGHVAVLSNCSTAVLVPLSVWSLMQSAEDYSTHFIPATLLRLLRWLAVFTTSYASALYVAIVSYHPSMLPTELLLAIASAREAIPLPAALEVVIMELAFELIREAGVRVPTLVGPTIAIVGAVVLGQAAVQASIVSPIPVVVVAISGLGSYAIPDYHLNIYVRMVKFLMIGAAAVLGIPGITFATVTLLGCLFSMRSFGVPMTAPLLPWWPHSPDLVFKGPHRAMMLRPGHTRPLDVRRQKPGLGQEDAAAPAGESAQPGRY